MRNKKVTQPKTALKGQAAPEQIEAWKKQYALGIYGLATGGHVAYFKNPDRNDMNCAMSKADKDAALDMFEELADLTFIGGSEDVLTDDTLFLGVVGQLKEKMDGEKATLLKL